MASSSEVRRKEWKKILYERQDYPDNFLDEEQFKKDLKKNLYLQPLSLSDALQFTAAIDQEILNVFVFVSIFLQLERGSNYTLYSTFVLSFLVAIATAYNTATNSIQLLEWFKQSLLFLLFLCGTLPILQTLTLSISSDSLWFMTIVMFLAHLLVHRYKYSGVLVSDAFSLNAAIFAAVCLSSRLSTSMDSFVLILAGVILFAFVPQIRNEHFHHMNITGISLVILVQWLIVTLSLCQYTPLIILLSLSVVGSLLGAWLYVKLQYLKNVIHGPWDEADVDLNQL